MKSRSRDDVPMRMGETYKTGYRWCVTVIKAQGIVPTGERRVMSHVAKGRRPGIGAEGRGALQQNDDRRQG